MQKSVIHELNNLKFQQLTNIADLLYQKKPQKINYQKNMDHSIKKVTIPERIFGDKKINNSEKLFLSIVAKFKDNGCGYSNEDFADLLNSTSKPAVANLVKRTKSEGKITVSGMGRKRKIYLSESWQK